LEKAPQAKGEVTPIQLQAKPGKTRKPGELTDTRHPCEYHSLLIANAGSRTIKSL
jgi:hypothetical protein